MSIKHPTEQAGGFRVSRTGDSPWEEVGPGVSRRGLFEHSGVRSWIYRFEPASGGALDKHPQIEWGYVLRGALEDETYVFPAGTAFQADAGTWHHPRSEEGAEVVIVEIQTGDGRLAAA